MVNEWTVHIKFGDIESALSKGEHLIAIAMIETYYAQLIGNNLLSLVGQGKPAILSDDKYRDFAAATTEWFGRFFPGISVTVTLS